MSASINMLSRTAAGMNMRVGLHCKWLGLRPFPKISASAQYRVLPTAGQNIRVAGLLETDPYYSPALTSHKFTHFHKKKN